MACKQPNKSPNTPLHDAFRENTRFSFWFIATLTPRAKLHYFFLSIDAALGVVNRREERLNLGQKYTTKSIKYKLSHLGKACYLYLKKYELSCTN